MEELKYIPASTPHLKVQAPWELIQAKETEDTFCVASYGGTDGTG